MVHKKFAVAMFKRRNKARSLDIISEVLAASQDQPDSLTYLRAFAVVKLVDPGQIGQDEQLQIQDSYARKAAEAARTAGVMSVASVIDFVKEERHQRSDLLDKTDERTVAHAYKKAAADPDYVSPQRQMENEILSTQPELRLEAGASAVKLMVLRDLVTMRTALAPN